MHTIIYAINSTSQQISNYCAHAYTRTYVHTHYICTHSRHYIYTHTHASYTAYVYIYACYVNIYIDLDSGLHVYMYIIIISSSSYIYGRNGARTLYTLIVVFALYYITYTHICTYIVRYTTAACVHAIYIYIYIVYSCVPTHICARVASQKYTARAL